MAGSPPHATTPLADTTTLTPLGSPASSDTTLSTPDRTSSPCSCHHRAGTIHRLVNTRHHCVNKHTPRTPAANTELTPHTDLSTPDTTVSPPLGNDISPTLTTIYVTSWHAVNVTQTSTDSTWHHRVNTTHIRVTTSWHPASSHRPPLTAPDNTVSTPLTPVSPRPDTSLTYTAAHSTRWHSTIAYHHSVPTQHIRHTIQPTSQLKLEPPSPPGESAQHVPPPHTSGTASHPYNNERLADLHINRLGSCRTYSYRKPTSNCMVLQSVVANDCQGLALRHRGCCAFYALMQPNESSTVFSKSRTHRLHPRIEFRLQRLHGLPRAKHSPQQRHRGPEVPTNLIRVAPAMTLPLHNTQCHNMLLIVATRVAITATPLLPGLPPCFHLCVVHPASDAVVRDGRRGYRDETIVVVSHVI